MRKKAANFTKELEIFYIYHVSVLCPPLKRQRKVPLIIWANKHLQLSPSFESGEASTHLLHSAFALDAWKQTSWSIGVLIAHFGTEPQHLQLVLDVKFGVMKGVFSPQAGCLYDGQVSTNTIVQSRQFRDVSFVQLFSGCLGEAWSAGKPHSVENDTAKQTIVLEGPILHLS